MTCRHSAGDPNCSKSSSYRAPYQEPKTPDKENYEILEVADVGGNLVLKVLYPNCSKCAYEGTKIMVFLGVTTLQALKWRIIDPHFGDPSTKLTPKHAPFPSARFPATQEGWADALAYARTKSSGVKRG